MRKIAPNKEQAVKWKVSGVAHVLYIDRIMVTVSPFCDGWLWLVDILGGQDPVADGWSETVDDAKSAAVEAMAHLVSAHELASLARNDAAQA